MIMILLKIKNIKKIIFILYNCNGSVIKRLRGFNYKSFLENMMIKKTKCGGITFSINPNERIPIKTWLKNLKISLRNMEEDSLKKARISGNEYLEMKILEMRRLKKEGNWKLWKELHTKETKRLNKIISERDDL